MEALGFTGSTKCRFTVNRGLKVPGQTEATRMPLLHLVVRMVMSSGVRPTFLVMIGALAVCLLSVPLSAQVKSAGISGSVTDSTGAVIVGAEVTVTDQGTKVSQKTVTTSSAGNLLLKLPLGNAEALANAQWISVESPAYRSDVNGNTSIRVHAFGYRSPLIAKSWLPRGTYGSDSTVAQVTLDRNGDGTFSFPANLYPHGPIAVRITGERTSDGYVDTCHLQLYNTGGISWNEGIPSAAPPAATGMSLVFQDDFDGPLSISGSGVGTRYAAHKPDGKDFGQIPFSNPTASGPFFQRDTYLIIRANALRNTTGLISSVNTEGTGFTVKAPYYMECRFIAPDALETWPAWWAMTDEYQNGRWDPRTDEIDTIEAYGWDGPKNPNAPGSYKITPHTWGYSWPVPPPPVPMKHSRTVPMENYGGGGGWADTPHTYGLLVTLTNFVFYLDNIEVLRVPASPLAEKDPMYFMVNLAIHGKGRPVDLSRYENVVDMYVDYIRVYR